MAFALPSMSQRSGFLANLAELTGTVRDRLMPARRPLLRQADRAGTPAIAPAVRYSPADQWAKLSKVLTNSVTAAEEAQKLQKAATQQLDLAQYAISALVDELAAVMAVSGRRDRTATLHVLGTAGSDTGSHRSVSHDKALAA